ncbi:MAG: AMP-binding protein [Thaumarchaeota archaeon]|nr:AMP-binding protein [Nitrososphaerota archaeon]MCL5066952.1 AMP-binding protein [Nitrososphaerota archaeon]
MKIPVEGSWINDWLAKRSSLTPDWVAILDNATGEMRRFTFSDLNARASRVAAYLKHEIGIKKGDLLCLLSWPRVEVLDLLFACSKLGAILFPLNTRYTSSEISNIVQEFKPRTFVFEDEFRGQVEGISKFQPLINLDPSKHSGAVSYSEVLGYGRSLEQVEEVSLEDTLMILHTGGTTGKPKAAIVNHRMILWNAVNTVRDLIIPYDLTITAVPLYHIGGFTYTIPLLFWGGANILMHRWSQGEFLKLVEQERPTFLFLVPAQLSSLIASEEFKKTDFSSVRFITSGGAALTTDMIQATFEKGITQKQGFGMTEMGPGIFALDPWDGFLHMGSIGKPNLLVEAKTVREDGRAASPEEEGELLLRGPSLFGGYWKDEEETEKTFEDRWMRTGDVARVDKEGYFYVVGRKKNVIRSGSESVLPEEVEKVLLANPAVKEVVVVGVPDQRWGEVPKALVVRKLGHDIGKEDIIAFCEGKLAKFKIPKYVQFVREIPKDSMGKTSRAKLAREFGNPSDTEES